MPAARGGHIRPSTFAGMRTWPRRPGAKPGVTERGRPDRAASGPRAEGGQASPAPLPAAVPPEARMPDPPPAATTRRAGADPAPESTARWPPPTWTTSRALQSTGATPARRRATPVGVHRRRGRQHPGNASSRRPGPGLAPPGKGPGTTHPGGPPGSPTTDCSHQHPRPTPRFFPGMAPAPRRTAPGGMASPPRG